MNKKNKVNFYNIPIFFILNITILIKGSLLIQPAAGRITSTTISNSHEWPVPRTDF